jgi:polyhydroxyalkanoate synthesis regulator phasin
MPDAWRAYLEMALGLTEAPRKKAQQVAGELVNRGGATAAQLQGLAEDLLSAGMANREALTNIVRYEVDRALGVVGLATADEVSELTARVRDLERRLRDAQARAVAAETAGVPAADLEGTRLDRPAPAPRPVAKKAVAKKAVAKKAPAKSTPAKSTPAKSTPAKSTSARSTPGKAAAAKKVAPVKKAAPQTPEA